MPEIGSGHKIRHQNGGDDEISVTGLSGSLADAQTPAAHKTSHQNGGTDEISLVGLGGQLVFVPYNAKLADVTEDDTDKHFLDLATPLGETRTIVGIQIRALRQSGSGYINIYPNEGNLNIEILNYENSNLIIIAAASQRLQYGLTAANDDWDLYCVGYCVIGA